MKKLQNKKLVLVLVLVILCLGFILRIYKPAALFMYNHDNDLSSWFVKDVLVNKHLRLIGQETSTKGIFIGGLYYYLLIPFYLLFNMDPIGGVYLVALLGIFTMFSFYFVFSKILSPRAGIVALILYSFSYFGITNDRWVVPTMPVVIWSVWYLYSLHLIIKGNTFKGYLISGLLIGLIWHLNISLVLTLPLIFVAQYLSKKKLIIKNILAMAGVILFTSLPLIYFEVKHSFIQLRSLIEAMSINQADIYSGSTKVDRVFYLFSKHFSNILSVNEVISYQSIFVLGILLFFLLLYKRIITKSHAIILFLWMVLYFVFFSGYSKIVSEYYLDGTAVVWIFVLTAFITHLLNGRWKYVGLTLLALYSLVNVDKFLSMDINKSGYIQRSEIISAINIDRKIKGFDCVSISYLTNPGYDLGYRYFIFLEGLKLKPISDQIPVYSIVFPLAKDGITSDKTFGALGLVLPDYSKYTKDTVNKFCEGEDINITQPMWGFPE